MSCSAPQRPSLGLGELLCTHRSVVVPPGRAKAFSPVTSTGNVPVPIHVVPCVVALEGLGGSALLCFPWLDMGCASKGQQGSSGSHGLSVLDGQNLFVLMPGRQRTGPIPEKRDLSPLEGFRK